jgi:hypothetical protein
MAVTFPAQLVKLVRTNPDSFFQFIEASIQLAEERLPFLKAQEWRELPATLRVALTVGPKRGKNLLLASFDVTENQKEGVIILVVRQPRSQPNRPRDGKTVLFPARVVRVNVVDSVLKFLPAFLADADCASF